MTPKKIKQKTCRECKCKYIPKRILSPVCESYECKVGYAIKAAQKSAISRKKREQRETKVKLDGLKTRQEHLKDAQQWVNKYVRLRDRYQGCISCDKPTDWGKQWHASHFRSTKAASAVRFNLWNIHKSCSVCNNWLSGNLSEYEPRLIAKIGQEKVDWLKSQNQTVTYSIEYLKRLKGIFKKKCARLEKRL